MLRRFLFGGLGLAAVIVAGCNATTGEPPAVVAPAPAREEGHGHQAGAHGGAIIPLGRDSYHVEAVFEAGGVVRLYTLGRDEARVQEVEAGELAAFATPDGAAEATPLTFRPDPQPGDAAGKTSRFTAVLPKELAGKTVRVTVPSLAVGGERFRAAFANEARHADAAMPAKRATDEERALFLTPGGRYTAADIKANGETVPTLKFAGIRPTHDARPKPGAKVCPIPETVSNPKFAWVVGGQRYEFCCVPCVEEFVATAKDTPDAIKGPDAYRAK